MTKSLNSSPIASAEARKTRAAILAVAELHFKHYGYQKTTVADVAKECAMSHANIYRFFKNKADLVDAVAELWLEKLINVSLKVADQPGTAAKRLTALALELHRMKKKEQLRGARVHELLSKAARDGRPCIEAHETKIANLFAKIIEGGIETGEFAGAEPATLGVAMHAATIKFCHPFLVEQYQDQDLENQLHVVLNLVIQGLSVKTADGDGSGRLRETNR